MDSVTKTEEMIKEIKGTRSRYEIRGEAGDRVVLLHGWGCTGAMMENLAGALQAEHRVMIIDFPGFGQSSRPPEPWGVPEYAAWLKELIDQTAFGPCAAIGHSFGCRVAAWAASEWPEMFTRLVFTGAAGLRATQTEEEKRRSEAFRKKKSRLYQTG